MRLSPDASEWWEKSAKIVVQTVSEMEYPVFYGGKFISEDWVRRRNDMISAADKHAKVIDSLSEDQGLMVKIAEQCLMPTVEDMTLKLMMEWCDLIGYCRVRMGQKWADAFEGHPFREDTDG